MLGCWPQAEQAFIMKLCTLRNVYKDHLNFGVYFKYGVLH